MLPFRPGFSIFYLLEQYMLNLSLFEGIARTALMDGVESTDLVRVRKVREIRRILQRRWYKWHNCTDPAAGKCKIVPVAP